MIDKKILEKTQLQRMTCGLTWLFGASINNVLIFLGGGRGQKLMTHASKKVVDLEEGGVKKSGKTSLWMTHGFCNYGKQTFRYHSRCFVQVEHETMYMSKVGIL